MLNKNRIIKGISPSVRLCILILLILSIIVAKSVYLILLITTITLLICVLSNEKLSTYVKFFKKVYFLLLIFLIAYIIVFRGYNLLLIILTLYKIINISLLVKAFELSINFDELHEAIYGIMYIFKRFNIENFSFNIAISLSFIKFWFDSKDEIINIKKLNSQKFNYIGQLIVPRLIYSIYCLNRLQLSLKLNFYKLKYNKSNIASKILLLLFLIFFIICIFKEVIL